MLDRHDLTDQEWARLEPLLPVRKPCRGGRWADHRTVLNGVFWRTFSGSPKKPAAKPGREALGRSRGGVDQQDSPGRGHSVPSGLAGRHRRASK
ncbi:transposase [Pseudonocardia sp.]|uniref:transposase n=1 Tax=Pseudonocardia sp. TaxID=60912 RepID=UPI0039C981DE